MLEEWCKGIWYNAELAGWDVSHYEDGCAYAVRERAAILTICQGIMSWCVILCFANLCRDLWYPTGGKSNSKTRII